MKALVIVDVQNDFLPGGALAVPDGDSVVAVANRLMSQFDFVVATQDWHPANHGSFAAEHPGVAIGDVFELNGLEQVAWPVHCVQGTVGAEFSSLLNLDSIDEIVQKGTDASIDSYSGFFDNGRRKGTGLFELLSAKSATEVHVLGLATDYCVKFTALDSVQLGFETHLVLEGCRGVELKVGDVAAAIDEMQMAGVRIYKK